MTKILEWKENLVRWYGKWDTYLTPVVKFVLSFAFFMLITNRLHYMQRLNSIPAMLVLALICCLLPSNITLLFAALLILLELYSLAVEAAVVALVLFLTLYFLYFRFCPGESVAAILTPVCFGIRIPYIMPVGCGLLRKGNSILAVLVSTLIWYFLKGIRQNEALFRAAAEDDAEISSKFSIAVAQITGNYEMFLVMAVFLLTMLVVYYVRRMSADYAWTIAIVLGIAVELAGLIIGYLALDIKGKTLEVLIGGAVSLLLALLIRFFRMNLDYARTERVSFEDDEYYYYVKAVPKKMIASEEKVVMHFSGAQARSTAEPEETFGDRIIAQELDFEEEE